MSNDVHVWAINGVNFTLSHLTVLSCTLSHDIIASRLNPYCVWPEVPIIYLEAETEHEKRMARQNDTSRLHRHPARDCGMGLVVRVGFRLERKNEKHHRLGLTVGAGRDRLSSVSGQFRPSRSYTMNSKAGSFTFAVPEGHAEAGKKIEKAFNYDVCETKEEAEKVLADKNMSIVDLVNDKLKANARSNAYQAALLPYRPSEVSEDDIYERMFRDLIRTGRSEDEARNIVAGLRSINGNTQ